MRTLDQEPETKKFKPEVDEKPIVKSLSDTDILKDSNNDVDLKPAGLTKSTSLVTSGSSAETLMPPPPTSGKNYYNTWIILGPICYDYFFLIF